MQLRKDLVVKCSVNLSLPNVKTEAGRERYAKLLQNFDKLPVNVKTEQPLLRFKNRYKSINLDLCVYFNCQSIGFTSIDLTYLSL